MSDQPTIITNRQPFPNPVLDDPLQRILEGRVLAGDQIGEFELIEYIGGGGMGRVFHALDPKLERPVALKVLAPELAADADSLQRFQNEAQSAAKLDHENIVRVYGIGEDRGLHYIAFEFVAGENLRQLVERKGPLPLDEALGYTRQIIAALEHAYERGIVHRDIKPSNILINAEGRVKLIDMGLARWQQAGTAGDMTASGVTLGTFDYISPEQARDPRSADARSDIYSLGCTLFFMLTGRPPFPEGTLLQKLLQHQTEPPPDVRRFRPDLPPEISLLLTRMMAKEPQYRPASPQQLVDELTRISSGNDSHLSSFGECVVKVGHAIIWPHLSWAAPVTVLLFIVFLLGRLWLSEPPSTEPLSGKFLPPEKTLATATKLSKESHSPPTSQPLSEQPSLGALGHSTTDKVEQQVVPSPQSAESEDMAATQPLYDSPWPEPLSQWWAPPFGSPKFAERAGNKTGENHEPGEKRLEDPVSVSRDAENKQFRLAESSPSGKPADEVIPFAPRNVLIVSDSGTGENHFSSLAAACAVARDGDTIELRFNGPREEQPLKLANVEVTIRAGTGYQPVLLFRPAEYDPLKYPRSMITLAGCRLTLSNVALELHVPQDLPAESWTLVKICGGQSIRLERCALTICNASDQLTAYHRDTAFFRIRPAANAPPAVISTAAPLTTIELSDSVVRGEAGLLRLEQLQTVHLLWNNGLLITCEPLLVAEGNEIPPRTDEILRLELRHITAVARGGLFRFTGTLAKPYQPVVQIVCTDTIVLGTPGTPLIEQAGVFGVDRARQQISWSSDRVCYEDVDIFWMVSDADLLAPIEVMTSDAWKSYWGPSRENRSRSGRLPWQSHPSGDKPCHTQTPADYTLEGGFLGEVLGSLPGCIHHRLPLLP